MALYLALADFRGKLENLVIDPRWQSGGGNGTSGSTFSGKPFKEILNRNVENLRESQQFAGADPIYSFLVFLQLLKGQIDLLGQLGLS